MLTMTNPVPMPVLRLPKQTLHHAWAPKLRRPVMFTSVSQVHLWVMLEANPSVTRYCERPACAVEDVPESAADFWVLRDGKEQWLTLEDDFNTSGARASKTFDRHTPSSPCVEIISRKEIERHRLWIQNWMSLLPYLATGRHLIDPTLSESIVQFFDRTATLERAEQHFSRVDPVLVRTAVIAGLHAGRLFSTDLLGSPLSRHTRVNRYRRGDGHEA
jgi:hypothetical protein